MLERNRKKEKKKQNHKPLTLIRKLTNHFWHTRAHVFTAPVLLYPVLQQSLVVLVINSHLFVVVTQKPILINRQKKRGTH